MNTQKTTSEPKTLQEAITQFSDPQRALDYLIPLVWPDGVTCAHCKAAGDHHFIASRKLWRCAACGKQFSIRQGTVMEDSPLGLDKWLAAMWLIANAKNGVSSYEIHRALGITQKSAWFLLHRIRLAMKTGSFKKMSGEVEADECFIGGKIKNFSKSKLKALRRGLKPKKLGMSINLSRVVKKSPVMGLLERGRDGSPSQIRVQHIEVAHKPQMMAVVQANVTPGAFLLTDSSDGYAKACNLGYIHMAVNHAIAYAEGRIHCNGLENFWSLLARTIKGTYVAVEPFHLDAYLDEQTFRFNNRKLNDGQRFNLVASMMGGKRVTYAELTGKVGTAQPS